MGNGNWRIEYYQKWHQLLFFFFSFFFPIYTLHFVGELDSPKLFEKEEKHGNSEGNFSLEMTVVWCQLMNKLIFGKVTLQNEKVRFQNKIRLIELVNKTCLFALFLALQVSPFSDLI